ncbi:hypothetical protein Slin15195_G022860 [Septoria linicola]|uniref:Uncharacterized protein n=1 Tax=Septoria linicola TaxID=215465 RepID=A0A9Q9AGY3_9PEZI|nr:hypothetical protein Slin15195_G022860 [Septoria linicola]
MRLSSLAVLTAYLSSASADFFVSNTSVCMGAFLISHCTHGVKVLSNVANDTKEAPYTCDHLVHAEDNNYIHNGTMTPFLGDDFVSSASGICGSGQLDFIKDPASREGAYIVNDKEGKHVGDCVPEKNASAPAIQQRCNQWIGMLFFASAFKCTSSVCS